MNAWMLTLFSIKLLIQCVPHFCNHPTLRSIKCKVLEVKRISLTLCAWIFSNTVLWLVACIVTMNDETGALNTSLLKKN